MDPTRATERGTYVTTALFVSLALWLLLVAARGLMTPINPPAPDGHPLLLVGGHTPLPVPDLTPEYLMTAEVGPAGRWGHGLRLQRLFPGGEAHLRYTSGRQRLLQEVGSTVPGARDSSTAGARGPGGDATGTAVKEVGTSATGARGQVGSARGTAEKVVGISAAGARVPGVSIGIIPESNSGNGDSIGNSRSPGLNIPAVFAFGDANTCTGNDDYRVNTPLRSNFPPYGRAYFPVPTGRASDGRLVVDYLAQYLRLPLLPPSLRPGANFSTGASFATGGASATASAFEPGWGMSLPQQVEGFMALRTLALAPSAGPASSLLPTPRTLQNALYFIQIGEVNFLQLILQAQATGSFAPQVASFAQARVQSDVLQSITSAMQKLYAAGARKFLVMAIIPTGCAPLIRAQSGNTSCVAYVDTMMVAFNEALGRLLQSLRANLTGSTIIFSRADRVLVKIQSDPAAYGFEKDLTACCGSGTFNGIGPCGVLGYTVCPVGEQRIYWDQFHNTQAVFALMARDVWTGTRDDTYPINLQTLSRT